MICFVIWPTIQGSENIDRTLDGTLTIEVTYLPLSKDMTYFGQHSCVRLRSSELYLRRKWNWEESERLDYSIDGFQIGFASSVSAKLRKHAHTPQNTLACGAVPYERANERSLLISSFLQSQSSDPAGRRRASQNGATFIYNANSSSKCQQRWDSRCLSSRQVFAYLS